MANNGRVVADCPACEEGVLLCTDSRTAPDKSVVRRRRKKCKSCGYVCSTHEVIVSDNLGLANSQQQRALNFLREVEQAARDHFGDDDGNLLHGQNVAFSRLAARDAS